MSEGSCATAPLAACPTLRASRTERRGGRPLARRVAPVLALLLLLTPLSASARNWIVQAGGSRLEFFPQELVIDPGDTVTFTNLGGFHNVMADDGAFRCANGCDGQGGNGAPSSQIWRATLRFDRSGRFGYFCEPHGHPGGGMYGTIIVTAAPVGPTIAVPTDGTAWRWLLVSGLLISALWWLRSRHGNP